METKTYQFIVNYEQDEDGVYIAEVPSLPGCHSFGSTLEEAEKNIREAIEGYLEVLKAHNEPIPTEDSVTFFLKKPASVTVSA